MSPPGPSTLAADSYLDLAAVKLKFGGRSDMWLFRQMRDNGFPQPYRFGGSERRYWLVSELTAWDEANRTKAPSKRKAPRAA